MYKHMIFHLYAYVTKMTKKEKALHLGGYVTLICLEERIRGRE